MTTETAQLAFGTTIDTEKLLGLKGGTFQATVTFRRGDNLVANAGLGTCSSLRRSMAMARPPA
jgi:porin